MTEQLPTEANPEQIDAEILESVGNLWEQRSAATHRRVMRAPGKVAFPMEGIAHFVVEMPRGAAEVFRLLLEAHPGVAAEAELLYERSRMENDLADPNEAVARAQNEKMIGPRPPLAEALEALSAPGPARRVRVDIRLGSLLNFVTTNLLVRAAGDPEEGVLESALTMTVRSMRGLDLIIEDTPAWGGEFLDFATRARITDDWWQEAGVSPGHMDRLFQSARTQRRQVKKIGRNDPCSCGSGAKFKKCCA